MLAVSSAAGIGGGGIVIPVCLVYFRFVPSQAIALTNVCVFVSSAAWFLFNFKDKHPAWDAVIIDYEIVMIMLPTTFLGSLIGI